MTGSTEIPRQKLPRSKKNKKWAKKCVDAFFNISRFSGSKKNQEFLEKLYKYYNGQIDHGDYTHVTRPFGETRKNFPAKLYNYNIIKRVVDALLGEKAKRPFVYSVVNTSPDAVTAKKQAFMKFARKEVEKNFINELNSLGVPTGQQEMEAVDLSRLKETFNERYSDARAILGQKALDYMRPNLELDDKRVNLMKHFIISGNAVSWRGVNYDEPEYDILNPLNFDGDKDPEIKFYEDGDWQIYYKIGYPSSVIDTYYDELTPDQIERLENPQNSNIFSTTSSHIDFANSGDQVSRYDRTIEVVKVYWKSRKKIGFVNYTDSFGRTQTKQVEEGYTPGVDETIEWDWVNEVWEGHRIDGDIYVRCRPMPNQRRSLDNPSKCKLPINGRKFSDMNAENISLVAMVVPYQLTFNIYKYKLDLAIAKSKDRVAQFDINMIPKKWSPEEFMYWIETTGLAFVDYNKENIKLSPQHQSVMDLTIQTISQYIELLQAIIEEVTQMTGVNLQRLGIVGQHAGKGTTEQAIVQGSNVTENMFRKIARMEQRDLQALLDYSKVAWIEGKKGQYIMPDGSYEEIDIDGLQHMESEYGVFVSDQASDVEKLEMVKQLVQPMIQNGASMETIAEVINSDSFAEINTKIKKAEKKRAQLEQKLSEIEAQQKQAERQHDLRLEQMETQRNIQNNQTKLQIAQIKASDNSKQRELELKEKEFIEESRQDQEELQEEKRSNKANEEIERLKVRAQKQKASSG